MDEEDYWRIEDWNKQDIFIICLDDNKIEKIQREFAPMSMVIYRWSEIEILAKRPQIARAVHEIKKAFLGAVVREV